MNRFSHSWFIYINILLLAGTIQAAEVATSISEVFHEGGNERLGSFSLIFDRDELSSASETRPIYIRFRPSFGRGWSKTRVDLRHNAPEETDTPINIALSVISSIPGVRINPDLPADTVQLVRMIQGEPDAWLKFKVSSSEWLTNADNSLTSPSAERRVQLSLGIPGLESIVPDTNTATGGNEFQGSNITASTRLCVNFENTDNFLPGDVVSLDFISLRFDDSNAVETEATVPTGGINVGVSFSQDTEVARGAFFVARYAFHEDPDNFDALPTETRNISRLQLENQNTYCLSFPELHITNTGDYEWEPGSNALLGGRLEGSFEPAIEIFAVIQELEPSAIRLTSSDQSVWQATIWRNSAGVFQGFLLTLLEGTFQPDSRLTIRGISGCFPRSADAAKYEVFAEVNVLHRQITDGELLPLSRTILRPAVYVPDGTAPFRSVIPYNAFDKEEWRFNTHLVNQSTGQGNFTALLYNSSGSLLRVERFRDVPGQGHVSFSVLESFGTLADQVLNWIELLGDKPFSAVGMLEDEAETVLDAIPSFDNPQQQLYGPHLPDQEDTWETNAYVVSSELDKAADYAIHLPNLAPEPLRGILVPGDTAILRDTHFQTSTGRAPWFIVEGSEPAATGILLFSKLLGGNQVASVSLNEQPTESWVFDHVGSPAAGWFSGLVIFNPSGQPAEIQLRGLDDSNQAIAESLTVNPLTRIAQSIESFFPATQDTLISRLEVQADVPVVCFLLINRNGADMLTAVPGNSSSGKSFMVPYNPKGPNQWIGMALYNPGEETANFNLIPRTADGSQGLAQPFSIPPMRKTLVLAEAETVSGPYTHYQIVSDQAIRGLALTGDLDNNQLATLPLDLIQNLNSP